ncbi:MAG: AraC family transcriptional regulator [Burkholderiaceae bacterium]|nr:AraC family transcriptional regulator [Burkholderiaceae bacterium]
MPLPDQTQPRHRPPLVELHMMLVPIIERWTRGVEDCSTPIASLTFFRREAPTEPAICLVEPSVVLVVQGKKRMWLGGNAYDYDTGHTLITSLELPANSEVVVASPAQPCLGLALKLDLRVMAELVAHSGLPSPRGKLSDSGMGIGVLTPQVLEPFQRLLDLLDEPEAIEVLSPLILREIYYRLLMSDQAARLRQIVSVGSQSHRIAKAIDWLKLNYSTPLSIDELSGRVQMSSSSFHHHFRQLTGMSPLQYQKWLRLSEARRLMLDAHLDAASSAYQVGYESPSQFSREYSRLFGAPPRRDIENLRLAVAHGEA